MNYSILTLILLLLAGLRALPAQTAALTAEEQNDILFLVEEEKLARDVYRHLQTHWNLPVFENIARAQQYHLDLMKELVREYRLDMPLTVQLDEAGRFNNRELQQRYDQLINAGSRSLDDALRTGARIEETGIIDLLQALDRTDQTTLRNTYLRLLRASRNHLRAFTNLLESRGVTYDPASPPAGALSEAVEAAPERSALRGRRSGKCCGAGCGCRRSGSR